jgi:hypothetical protein
MKLGIALMVAGLLTLATVWFTNQCRSDDMIIHAANRQISLMRPKSETHYFKALGVELLIIDYECRYIPQGRWVNLSPESGSYPSGFCNALMQYQYPTPR